MPHGRLWLLHKQAGHPKPRNPPVRAAFGTAGPPRGPGPALQLVKAGPQPSPRLIGDRLPQVPAACSGINLPSGPFILGGILLTSGGHL